MTYRRRVVDGVLDAAFGGLPAVMLVGPRACGKTTTALRRAASVIRLDDLDQARAFRADPDAILAGLAPPVLIDEWQDVPESMGAVKRAVDTGPGGGRFLIAGSVRARGTGQAWPGTGRVVPLRMFGLTRSEIEGRGSHDILDRLFAPEDPPSGNTPGARDLTTLADAIVRGGFPEAVDLGDLERGLWFAGYVDQLVHRDVERLAEIRSPGRLAALLDAVAATTSGTPAISTLATAAGIDPRTTATYLDLLEDLGMIVRLPAWHHNALKRLVKAPKIHLADTGMAAHLLGVDVPRLLLKGGLLGQLLETFVVLQLVPHAAISAPRVRVSHLRDANGQREVDLVLERPGGDVVGVEVKAAASADARDARHLAWLRDELGEQFVRGVVLHTGDATYPLSERIWAMPIASLWR
jgi:predicted AAA+ superfamily ATPase